jgi:hypothetical protein
MQSMQSNQILLISNWEIRYELSKYIDTESSEISGRVINYWTVYAKSNEKSMLILKQGKVEKWLRSTSENRLTDFS